MQHWYCREQHTAKHSNTQQSRQHPATHCNTLEHAGKPRGKQDCCCCGQITAKTLLLRATHCKNTATHCNTLPHLEENNVGVVAGKRMEKGLNLLARATPRCREIHHNQQVTYMIDMYM